MKANFSILVLTLSVLSSALPQPSPHNDAPSSLDPRDFLAEDFNTELSDLWKRKGGGGGSRGGGGGSTGGGSTGTTGGTAGGRTTGGSGPPPSYGAAGRTSYAGGSTVPYYSGSPSRSTGGITPYVFGGALGVAAFYPGLWLYGAYAYPYSRPWYYRNATTAANESKPVQCLCGMDSVCGCDENDDTSYQAALLGDGTYAGLNKSVITVANLNGTDTILLNGTLPDDTTAAGGAATLIGCSWLMLATLMSALFLA